MGALIDLTGQRFGRFVVIKRDFTKGGMLYWSARCDCGAERIVVGGNLKRGISKSCGCYHRDRTSKRFRTHGLSGSSTFNIWKGMLARCYRRKSRSYKNYGGRGITVCERWKKFENFLHDMGLRPDGLTLERINNNAGYFPENCKWATPAEQMSNTRIVRLLTHNGETLPTCAWSRKLGLSQGQLGWRLRAGWPIQRALTRRAEDLRTLTRHEGAV